MKSQLTYIAKFLGVFCLLYFGTWVVIALASPGGGIHSDLVQKYFDYVSALKISLIKAPAFILSLFGIGTSQEPGFLLRWNDGRGVIIAYSCVGYGVYSFWTAFVVANKGSFKKKFIWVAMGLISLWFINVVRITLFLTSINKGWDMPFGLDHHTWFNIVAYLFIFIMIFLYDRSFRNKSDRNDSAEKTVLSQPHF
ncbi:MAG: exosortase/archaeosortase family protein [Chitinophagaceae bacterium]|nr:exosortase/archaeosortase family protein [Chitinophagaceae bacterium]